MRHLWSIVLLVLFSFQLSGQKVEQIGTVDLKDILNIQSDSVYVINFWATWCSPCVKELPYFEAVHRQLSEEKVSVKLINLDFPNQVEKRVKPFLNERQITASVYNMTEMDYNAWIPLVDKEWSGAIPATLILLGENRIFIPHELDRETLQEHINNIKQFIP